TRWGSCSSKGNLAFNWRLVLAPPEILDYVVAHEVAHLVHLDHGPDFHRLLERLCPEHRRKDRWLDEHGETLRI
ncbi:MAG: M48 family metallopeptidase, partial [Planctomycetes bacterium]|nr:M48 family metallopeptidase [Planctomycetota bacterium]